MPAAVDLPGTSSTLPLPTLTRTVYPPEGTSCHCWLCVPLSAHCRMSAPSAAEPPLTASALPLLRLISLYRWAGSPGVTARLSNCTLRQPRSCAPTAKPAGPEPYELSEAVPRVSPSTCAARVLPDMLRARLCHEFVPSAGRLPEARVLTCPSVSFFRIDHEPPSVTRR